MAARQVIHTGASIWTCGVTQYFPNMHRPPNSRPKTCVEQWLQTKIMSTQRARARPKNSQIVAFRYQLALMVSRPDLGRIGNFGALYAVAGAP